jgi:hypothetical protein
MEDVDEFDKRGWAYQLTESGIVMERDVPR